jgi:hypothetical protein
MMSDSGNAEIERLRAACEHSQRIVESLREQVTKHNTIALRIRDFAMRVRGHAFIYRDGKCVEFVDDISTRVLGLLEDKAAKAGGGDE